MEIPKVCLFCNQDFIAKTTVTKYCSHKCAARAYKLRMKQHKIEIAIKETNVLKALTFSNLIIENIRSKDFLSIRESYILLGVSERTFYRLMKDGTIKATKIGNRSIIKRSEIDKLFS